MAKTEYGIQMYSIRDIAEDSMRLALKEVAAMGYKHVEFAGFYDYTAEQLKIWLDAFGLVCSGSHLSLKLLTPETIEETIRYHKFLGCDTITVPSSSFATKEKAEETIEKLLFADRILKQHGIRLSYHNHSKEYFPNQDGIVMMDELLRTDIELQVDTFWLYNADIDVLEYLEAHKDRIRVIHLKDGISSVPENKTFDLVHSGVKGFSVGEGRAPVAAVREWAIKNNILMVVESEDLNPTGLQEIRRCVDFLRTLD